jgi:sugar phosphate isomerase/epimerase
MLIGAMNHPARPILDEIRWMAEMNLDFIDLTLEPPRATPDHVDIAAVRAALDRHGLAAVGHTAYYLPFASPFESIRQAAVAEAERCLKTFAQLGVAWMNVHPDRHVPLHDQDFLVEKNLESLRDLLTAAHKEGVGLMIENLPGELSTVSLLKRLLEPLPELGLHLDIGHANLMLPENTSDQIVATFSSRLRHVHLHDNKGGSVDLHLPIGVGNLNVERHLRVLKASGYDGTITLEVFTADSHYLAYSRDVLRRLWDEAPGPARTNAKAQPAMN